MKGRIFFNNNTRNWGTIWKKNGELRSHQKRETPVAASPIDRIDSIRSIGSAPRNPSPAHKRNDRVRSKLKKKSTTINFESPSIVPKSKMERSLENSSKWYRPIRCHQISFESLETIRNRKVPFQESWDAGDAIYLAWNKTNQDSRDSRDARNESIHRIYYETVRNREIPFRESWDAWDAFLPCMKQGKEGFQVF